MKDDKDPSGDEQHDALEEGETIEQGFEQMELLYRSRCVQAPTRSNVTVREINKDE